MQGYLGSRPQLERGALGLVVIAGKRSIARGGQVCTFVDLLEADTEVPRDCLLVAMDDRVGWRKRAMRGVCVCVCVCVLCVCGGGGGVRLRPT